MILTMSTVGEQPRVQRVHYYKKGLPESEPIDDIFSNSVFLEDDWNGQRLWLEMIVVEIDKSDNERGPTIDAFGDLAAKFGAVFPVLIPFAFIAKPVLKVVDRLHNALRKDDEVLRVPFSLYNYAGPGVAPLQEGYYVLFARHIDNPKRYRLDLNSGFVMDGNDHSDISYVVFSVRRGLDASPKFEISQSVARLLSQMGGEGQSAKESVDFLIETLTSYDNFRKLKRYMALKAKNENELTKEERDLIERIETIEELRPFISS
jgi:hypothetical protein